MEDQITPARFDRIRALEWTGQALRLIDQRRLPADVVWLTARTAEEVAGAIRDMVVRGAPAIGIAGAYGAVLSARRHLRTDARSPGAWEQDLALLARARPTAVNLGWALARMKTRLSRLPPSADWPLLLEHEARQIHEEDLAGNREIGRLGAALLPDHAVVLTHCNTGALATGGYGTALGIVRAAAAGGRLAEVYAGETRPWLQGARLTVWELVEEGIPVTLIADSAAAYLMQTRRIDALLVGADRITANGDVANKIGTYALALAARYHGVKVVVAAPLSTFDPETPDGSLIRIEERPTEELTRFQGVSHTRAQKAWNPVFDLTPASLIDAWVSDQGVVEAPDTRRIRDFMDNLAP